VTRPLRNVLCPVDFSKHSQRALGYAALLASRNDARLTVLFVEDPLLAAAATGTSVLATTRADLQRFTERTVTRYGIGPGSTNVRIAVGAPYREIARTAGQLECDLIVMGAHGVTGPSKLMLGSTTERVLRGAAVPILAIPPSSGRAATAVPRGWPKRQAIAPVELGRHLRRDVAAAAEVVEQLGTGLVLLHVVPPRNRSRLLKARTQLEAVVKTLKSAAVVGRHVVAGRPDEQITAMAADAGADLVILTRRRGKGLFGARLGTISYRVLCDAETPVMALPSGGTWRRRRARVVTNGARRAR
jgi:nucleotide-binding universal stress UspA family protein